MKYHEQINHPLWQKKRLEVMEANNFECEICGSKEDQLNIHHPFYKRGAMIWQYEIKELRCLCHVCHKEEHRIDEELKSAISMLCQEEKSFILGFVRNKRASNKKLPKDLDEAMGSEACEFIFNGHFMYDIACGIGKILFDSLKEKGWSCE